MQGATANVARTDVETAHAAAGKYHGLDVSYSLPEGSHTVCVTAHNIGFGGDTVFPCKTAVLNFTHSLVFNQ